MLKIWDLLNINVQKKKCTPVSNLRKLLFKFFNRFFHKNVITVRRNGQWSNSLKLLINTSADTGKTIPCSPLMMLL